MLTVGQKISAHIAGKDGLRVKMSLVAHQEKEKNEETKTVKRKAGEEKRQTTDFKEATCCPSAVVQGAAREKMFCARRVPGVTGVHPGVHFSSLSNYKPTQQLFLST